MIPREEGLCDMFNRVIFESIFEYIDDDCC